MNSVCWPCNIRFYGICSSTEDHHSVIYILKNNSCFKANFITSDREIVIMATIYAYNEKKVGIMTGREF